MADNETFNPGKWILGFFNPVTWSKSIVYGAMIAILLFFGFTIYRAYFMKTGSNINKPTTDNTIIMTPGTKITGNVTQNTMVKNEQKTEDGKRIWWKPIPYVSVFGEARGTNRSSLDNIEYGYGGQVGLRWDFN